MDLLNTTDDKHEIFYMLADAISFHVKQPPSVIFQKAKNVMEVQKVWLDKNIGKMDNYEISKVLMVYYSSH